MAAFANMALKATHGNAPFKYLGVIDDGTENQGYLEYSTEAVLTKNAKFAVEYAHSNLVHIRSCLTNKYWVRSSTDGHWIVAKGVEPVVDQTSWTCTLFRMDIDDNNKAKFYHVQSGCTIRVPCDGSARKMFLSIDPAVKIEAVSLAIDYDTFVVLPKFVAFKGSNGLFYKNTSKCHNVWTNGFIVSDIGDPDIVCEIRNTNDGHIRVKAANGYAFWSQSTTTRDDLVTCFWGRFDNEKQRFAATRVDKNVVALRCLGNQKFCMRSDFEPGFSLTQRAPAHNSSRWLDIRVEKDQLLAIANGVVRDSYLEVVEPLFNRTVSVYEFDLDKARVYDVELLYSHEHVWDNYTDENQSGSANGTISTTKSRTYSNSITVSGTVTTTFQAGVPIIANSGIQISASANYCYKWDQTVTEMQQVGQTFTVVVKPMKRTIARGVAMKGTCDVPFAYVQKDYPANGGPPIVTKLSDGVFTGANAYNFHDEVRYDDLPLQAIPKAANYS